MSQDKQEPNRLERMAEHIVLSKDDFKEGEKVTLVMSANMQCIEEEEKTLQKEGQEDKVYTEYSVNIQKDGKKQRLRINGKILKKLIQWCKYDENKLIGTEWIIGFVGDGKFKAINLVPTKPEA